MKAHEWVSKFKANFSQAVGEYVAETMDLVKTRRCTTPAAREGVFREQRQKWHKIVQSVPETDNYLFDDVMAATAPSHWAEFEKVQADRAIRIKTKAGMEEYKKNMDLATTCADPSIRLGLVIAAILDRLDNIREVQETYAHP